MPSTDWIHALKVVELKDELKKRGQPVAGKKAELAARLEAYVKENEASEPEGASPEAIPAEPKEAQPEAAQAPPADEAQPSHEPEAANEAPTHEATPVVEPESRAPDPAPKLARATSEPEAPMAVADVPPAPAVTNAPEPDSVPEVDVDYGESEGEEDSPEPAHEAPKQEPVKKAEVETAAPKSAAAEAPPSKEPPAQKKKEAPSGDHTQPRAPLFAAALSKIKRLEQREPASKDTEMPEGPTRKRPAEATEEAPPATKPVPDRPEKAAKLDASTSAAVAKPSSQQPAKAEVPAKAAALQGGGPASRALRVDGFVRPFTLNQARDLLSQSGTVLAMWMPNIKNLAYVVFATVAQAEAAHAALAGLQWPANSPSKLQPRYVTVAEAELAIGEGAGNPDFKIGRTDEDGPDDVAAGAAPAAKDTPAKGAAENPPEAVNNARAPAKEALDARKEDVEGVTDLRELLKRRQGAVAPPEAHPVAQQPQNGAGDNEPLSLDDLFRRTQAKPAIYWLPVSEEEIQRRERSKIVPAAPEEKGMQPNTAAS